MDSNILYLIALLGTIVLISIIWALKLVFRNPILSFSWHIYYPLLFSNTLFALTRLTLAIFIGFSAVNASVLLVPQFFPGWKELQSRAALAAVVNLISLCIGGRAPIIDILNFPRSWYYHLHSLLGIMVAIEALSHTIIALYLKPRPGSLVTSGWIVRAMENACLS